VGRVGIFERKSEITRRILGVLGRMRTCCVGIDVEHLFQQKRLGGRRLRGPIFFYKSPVTKNSGVTKTRTHARVFGRPPGL
jgi:hypothetical protein